MTHEELLVKIIRWFDYADGSIARNHEEFCITSDGCKCNEYEKVTDEIHKALRAVVELHKPLQGLVNEPFTCQACRFTIGNPVYPCPTIQAIKEQLK